MVWSVTDYADATATVPTDGSGLRTVTTEVDGVSVETETTAPIEATNDGTGITYDREMIVVNNRTCHA